MKTKTLWAARVNIYGLWFSKPVKVKWNVVFETYWDSSGNFDIIKQGLDVREGFVNFASNSKKDVELWIQGVKSAFSLLRLIAKEGYEISEEN